MLNSMLVPVVVDSPPLRRGEFASYAHRVRARVARVRVAVFIGVLACGACLTPRAAAPPPAPRMPQVLLEAESFYETRFIPAQFGPAARDAEEFKAQKAALERLTLAAQDHFEPFLDDVDLEVQFIAAVRFGESFGIFADIVARGPTPIFILDIDRRHPGAGAGAEVTYRRALAAKLAPYYQEAVKQCTHARALASRLAAGGLGHRLAQQCIERWSHHVKTDGTHVPTRQAPR